MFVWPIFFTSLVLLYFTHSLYTFPAGLNHDPLLLAQDNEALGSSGLADAGVKEVAPVFAVVVLEGSHVVLDVEEAAGVGSVDNLIEGVGLGVGSGSRGRVGVEGDVVGREMVGVGCVVIVSFVTTVAAMEDCEGRGGLWMNFRIYLYFLTENLIEFDKGTNGVTKHLLE
ncbi:unnamed protein product [Prunus armeniaca]|uniref:Uncharacterized protein n=1 Tax=Prunus armeniaca TaxID=36596 RepID=A0A6J5Y1U4_PRUAR|nr:unnamed protein product [Prunus armeniaca]